MTTKLSIYCRHLLEVNQLQVKEGIYINREKEYKEIPAPQVVDVYNKHMGGVDLLDSLLGLYRISIRSRQWYKKIFFHMIDMCIVNVYCIYRRKNVVYMCVCRYLISRWLYLNIFAKLVNVYRKNVEVQVQVHQVKLLQPLIK